MRRRARTRKAYGRGFLVAFAFGGFSLACGEDEVLAGSANASGSSGGARSAGSGGSAGESGGGGRADGSMMGASGGAGGSGGSGGNAEPEPTVVDLSFDFETIPLPEASRTVDFHFVPGTTDELYVLGHTGWLYHYRITENSAELLAKAEIPDTFQSKGCGATSFALDPFFTDNAFVYIARCVDLVNNTLARYQVDDFENLGQTEAELFTVTLERDRDEWHRFGSMGFEADNDTLWILVGDMFFPWLAQDTTAKNGSLVRIVPNRDPDGSGYERAFGNAFSDDSDNDPDIFAYGIRSPWRGTRDRFGRFWFGDVGDVTAEEVNLATEPGQNFGWENHEGPCESDCAGVRDPILWYGRGNGRAIWVGEMYEEPAIDRYYGLLNDVIFYGDYYDGWINGFTVNEHNTVTSDRMYGSKGDITQWRVGPDGFLYALTYTPRLYRVVPDPVYADEP